MNTQFADAFADRPHVTGIAEGQAANPGGNPRLRLNVPELMQPLRERVRLANLDHRSIVAYGLQADGWAGGVLAGNGLGPGFRGETWAHCDGGGLSGPSALGFFFWLLTQADGLGWYGDAPLALGSCCARIVPRSQRRDLGHPASVLHEIELR